MIVSHRHRFIFLKTRKTGGSSVEAALTRHCGPQDVFTPLEAGTAAQGGPGYEGRNFRIPFRVLDWPLKLTPPFMNRYQRNFRNHAPASLLARSFPDEWARYTKISILRNPWDREISRFFHENRAGRFADFDAFIGGRTAGFPLDNFEIHSINGVNAADVLMRQETLQADFERLWERLELDGTPPSLPRLKSQHRPPTARQYRDFYSQAGRNIVASVYRAEIEAFGYAF